MIFGSAFWDCVFLLPAFFESETTFFGFTFFVSTLAAFLETAFLGLTGFAAAALFFPSAFLDSIDSTSESLDSALFSSGTFLHFEAGFFVLAIVGIALAEIWGRGPAAVLWGVVTVVSLAARPLVVGRLGRTPPADRSEAQWRRAVDDSWRHFNKLMLLGLAALGGWWLLSRAVGG